MILVADASTLIAELVRERGRRLMLRSDLRLLVAEDQWQETERGLARRFDILRQRIGDDAVEELRRAVDAVVRTLDIIPRDIYAAQESTARRRVRDASDWPTVALALTVHAPILTSDPDFVGSGVATWTYDTLHAELVAESDVDDPSPAASVSPVVPWVERLGEVTLRDEARWATVAVRAARDTPSAADNSDRCADCGMLLPLDFSASDARLPCPRCVETGEGSGMRRMYARIVLASL